MQSIIHNDDQLTNENVKAYRHKVRAVIINKDNKILVTNYSGIYMLPGGKVENGEQEIQALMRELVEETGINFIDKKTIPLANIKNYLKDYPHRDGKCISRLTDTSYYLINTTQDIDLNNVALSQSEQEANFKIQWYYVEEIIDIVKNYQTSNPRKMVFDRDLLTIIALYKSHLNDLQGSIDLHTHSYHSDGELGPEALLAFAKSEGISTIAITDHDSLTANKEISKSLLYQNLNIISGIELSAKFTNGRLHILGYGLNINDEALNNKLEELRSVNLNKIIALIAQLKKDYGINFSKSDIKSLVDANHNLGRPDLARLLVKNSYVETIAEAFDKYLNEAYEKVRCYTGEVTYQECISLIANAGGIPVLAHPITLRRSNSEFKKILEDMIECGLMGIEVYHTKHDLKAVEKYLKIAHEYQLLISGGSDYHGPFIKPEVKLGTFHPNKERIISLSIVDYIKKRH